jgi:very-short-patch-repair endonuclease
MEGPGLQSPIARFWQLVGRQHGVVSRAQLLALGFGRQWIRRRIANGRLHPIRRGVYAVGRPQLSRHGHWMGAVLRCGPDALLSHRSAAALWQIGDECPGAIEVSVPAHVLRRPEPDIAIRRRTGLASADRTRHDGIPVTSPSATLIDLATCLPPDRLVATVNEADKRGLVDPDELRTMLDDRKGRPGVPVLRETLDRFTFVLTDSELERRFLPIARAAGLPLPQTGVRLNGFKVDFHWPDLGLVVETDGLRYHRTPAQQARDRLRDQAHTAAGLTPLRFTHAQVRWEPVHVRSTLAKVVVRLRFTAPGP